MELSQHSSSLLEELIMAPRIDTPFPNEYNINLPNNLWAFDQTPTVHFPSANASLLELISPPSDFNYPCPFTEFQPFFDVLTSPEYGSFYDRDDLPAMAIQEEYGTANVESGGGGGGKAAEGILDGVSLFEDGSSMSSSCYKSEMDHVPNMGIGVFNVDLFGEKRIVSKGKKPDGQPSKNLMAERRRRKRLNDRLSMLRSIVPKISKMDRTSILGDTIDYMRELLDKIHKLKEEGIDDNILNQINPTGTYLKDLKPNEMVVRNPPKFDVARRNKDTRVEVCCTPKPGLLLSTLSTLDAFGLDIQQCVISCFNDFSLQASCVEGGENQRIQSLLSSEDMKQALFRNAGYGGRCL